MEFEHADRAGGQGCSPRKWSRSFPYVGVHNLQLGHRRGVIKGRERVEQRGVAQNGVHEPCVA